MTTDEREELRRLRRESKQLRMEREILDRAAAWFAKESNSIPVPPHYRLSAQVPYSACVVNTDTSPGENHMGLTISHGAFQGPYSSLHDMRCAIALAAGWGDLDEYAGYRGSKPYPEPGDDILSVLMNHSDFDGTIAAEHAGPLADRLEAILPHIDAAAGDGYARADALQFVEGLRRASAAGEALKFS